MSTQNTNFYRMINRLDARGKLDFNLDSAELKTDITEEKQDVEEARSVYQDDVLEAELKGNEKNRKRGFAGLMGTTLGGALGAFGVVTPVYGALISGLASTLGRNSVAPYTGQIQNTLPGGKFHMQARRDLGRDINSTNEFIMDAAEGQGLLNLVSGIGDAVNTYRGLNAFFGPKPGIDAGDTDLAFGDTLIDGVDFDSLTRFNDTNFS